MKIEENKIEGFLNAVFQWARWCAAPHWCNTTPINHVIGVLPLECHTQQTADDVHNTAAHPESTVQILCSTLAHWNTISCTGVHQRAHWKTA